VAPEHIGRSGAVTVSVDVENAGPRTGDEVVQLYVADVVSSVTTPVKALKGFERVHLLPGQRRTVRFALGPRELALTDGQMERVVEPGAFEVTVGGSSQTVLATRFEVTR
jgi:beta-glucosidase